MSWRKKADTFTTAAAVPTIGASHVMDACTANKFLLLLAGYCGSSAKGNGRLEAPFPGDWRVEATYVTGTNCVTLLRLASELRWEVASIMECSSGATRGSMMSQDFAG